MDFGIDGKKALICASSKGLGKAIALALAKEGAQVFLCARTSDELRRTVDEVAQFARHPVTSIACDLLNRDGREELIAQVKASMGEIDILVHNIGGPKPSRAEETAQEDWASGFERLFQSVAHLNDAFLPGMKANQWGRILCVTSTSVFEPIADLAVSNALRPAVTAMMKTLADEVSQHNITVNCIAPGIILTDRTEERLNDYLARNPGGSRSEWLARSSESIPAKRLGHPDEFGACAAFLCSQQASYITGSTLTVDGGKRRSYH